VMASLAGREREGERRESIGPATIVEWSSSRSKPWIGTVTPF